MAKVTETHKITEGLKIYKQDNSKRWIASFKIGKKWEVKTTGCADKLAAIDKAYELRTLTKIMVDNNIPVRTSRRAKRNSFGELARNAIATMEATIEDGTAKSAYKHYIGVLNNYLIPFFDKTPVKDIDYEVLANFDKWRIEKMGKVPSKATINMQNTAMNFVFEQAINSKSIKESEVPKLKNNGKKGERRAYFSEQQYATTVSYIKKCIHQTDKPKTRTIRTLLYYYVEVAVRTGMRPGTEMNRITWGDLRLHKIKNEAPYTVISVREGKTVKHTGTRNIVCDDEVLALLEEYKKTLGEVKDTDLIFALPKDANMNILSDNFRTVLRKLGIQNTPLGKLTLYSLRHSYITWKLQGGLDVATIATQCGTSSEMIHKHYSHIVPTMFADHLSGRKNETPLTKLLKETEHKELVDEFVVRAAQTNEGAMALNTLKQLYSEEE